MRRDLSLVATLILCLSSASFARPVAVSTSSRVASHHAAAVGVPWTGEPGSVRSVAEIMALERQQGPITKRGIEDIEEREREEPDRSRLPQNPDSPFVSSWPARSGDTIADAAPPSEPGFTVRASFLGAELDESGLIPPDSMGAVGPTQVMVIVNGRVKTFDKTGARGALNSSTNAFFESVRNGAYPSDPRVRYDRLTNRWFITMITVAIPNRVLIAVSDGSEITDRSSFTFYQFQQDLVGPTPNTDTGALADYATLGVDTNALYLGANMFTASSYVGSTVFVVRKGSVLGGGPIVVTAFRNLASGSKQGIDTPQGVTNDDPNATEGYFVGVDTLRFGILNVRRVSDPGGVPSLSADIPVTVPATSLPAPVRPLGSGLPVDVSNDRLFAAEIRHNQFTGRRTLWTAHAIQVDADGVASASGGRTASRWYELGDLATAPRLLQASTVFDARPGTDVRSFLFPSITMTPQGHVVLGCTGAGPQDRAAVVAATRLASDLPGLTRPPVVVLEGSANYNVQTDSVQRWGDYSYTCVDPADGMSVWTFQEYCNATDSWGVRVVGFRAPPPATPVEGTPPTIAVGRTTTVTLTGVSTSGSGFFDPDATYPSHLRATLTGGGLTVSGLRLPDPTHIELTISAALDAATGPRGITIVNPDGQSVSADAVVEVGPALDSARVKKDASGKSRLLLTGAGFTSAVTVRIDGVAFSSPARVTAGRDVVQRGKLQNGLTINKAIRRGQTVTVTVENSDGAVATLAYTRQ